MFDDSDVEEVAAPKEELFKPVKPLKADKKPAAKKPAGEKKPRAPAKSKAQKKGLLGIVVIRNSANVGFSQRIGRYKQTFTVIVS